MNESELNSLWDVIYYLRRQGLDTWPQVVELSAYLERAKKNLRAERYCEHSGAKLNE